MTKRRIVVNFITRDLEGSLGARHISFQTLAAVGPAATSSELLEANAAIEKLYFRDGHYSVFHLLPNQPIIWHWIQAPIPQVSRNAQTTDLNSDAGRKTRSATSPVCNGAAFTNRIQRVGYLKLGHLEGFGNPSRSKTRQPRTSRRAVGVKPRAPTAGADDRTDDCASGADDVAVPSKIQISTFSNDR